MAYLTLYRKYRPTNWRDVIGQRFIVRTLINQVERDQVAHAYLFTGTRGTGKTSSAKIFARAINCLHPVDGSPCGECEVCRALRGSYRKGTISAHGRKVQSLYYRRSAYAVVVGIQRAVKDFGRTAEARGIYIGDY